MTGWLERFFSHLERTLALYFFCFLLLVLGVVFGALAVRALGDDQRAALLGQVQLAAQALVPGGPELSAGAVLRRSLGLNLGTVGLLWLLGATVVGLPAVLLVLFGRGFILGFTAGFLSYELGLRGVLVCLATLFPPSLFAVPALLSLGVQSLSFTLRLVRRRHRSAEPLSRALGAYTLATLALGSLLTAASLFEAYLSPVFLRLLAPLLL
ncbi:MAG: stage II sporulation protein M [Acetobacteraceae bacterium]|nr:stage II sporulation protein M [Acetobacteraceae bacterium]